ncbi:MAG: rhodanese-like domain-containing protein [Elusimicrobia bacterium]|nr:rhodanese-like domain-containing protein [Elusimicrobiota bacterium]
MKNKFKTPDPKKAKRFFSRKLAFTTGPVELGRWLKERKDIKIVDVRDPKSYAKGHIPRAVNLPNEKWHKTTALDKRKTNIVYCYAQTCHLATRAAFEFASQGFPVVELEGGFETWKEKGLPVEKRSAHKARKAQPKLEGQPVEAPAQPVAPTGTFAPAQTN